MRCRDVLFTYEGLLIKYQKPDKSSQQSGYTFEKEHQRVWKWKWWTYIAKKWARKAICDQLNQQQKKSHYIKQKRKRNTTKFRFAEQESQVKAVTAILFDWSQPRRRDYIRHACDECALRYICVASYSNDVPGGPPVFLRDVCLAHWAYIVQHQNGNTTHRSRSRVGRSLQFQRDLRPRAFRTHVRNRFYNVKRLQWCTRLD